MPSISSSVCGRKVEVGISEEIIDLGDTGICFVIVELCYCGVFPPVKYSRGVFPPVKLFPTYKGGTVIHDDSDYNVW